MATRHLRVASLRSPDDVTGRGAAVAGARGVRGAAHAGTGRGVRSGQCSKQQRAGCNA